MLGRTVRMVVSCLGLAICCREVASMASIAALAIHVAFRLPDVNKNIVILLLSIVATCHVVDEIIFFGEMHRLDGESFLGPWDRFGDRRFEVADRSFRVDRGHVDSYENITIKWFYDRPDDRSII